MRSIYSISGAWELYSKFENFWHEKSFISITLLALDLCSVKWKNQIESDFTNFHNVIGEYRDTFIYQIWFHGPPLFLLSEEVPKRYTLSKFGWYRYSGFWDIYIKPVRGWGRAQIFKIFIVTPQCDSVHQIIVLYLNYRLSYGVLEVFDWPRFEGVVVIRFLPSTIPTQKFW